MKIIYYLFVLGLAMYNLVYVVAPKARRKRLLEKIALAEKEDKTEDEKETETANQISSLIPKLFFCIVIFMGVFTFNWVLIIAYTLYSILEGTIIESIWGTKPSPVFVLWLQGVINFLVLMFLIINSYHLKIDFLELIQNL